MIAHCVSFLLLLHLLLLQLSESELLMLQQVADADMDGAITLEVRRGSLPGCASPGLLRYPAAASHAALLPKVGR
jgi:hypothetical protein